MCPRLWRLSCPPRCSRGCRRSRWRRCAPLPSFFSQLPFFSPILIFFRTFPPLTPQLVGYATNISENEPLFFALALAYAAAGAPAPWAAGAVKLYGASRFAHAATFLFETRQPTRAVAWLAGVGATVALGVAALSLKA